VSSVRITLDTNVLISSLVTAGGPADQVMQRVQKGEMELVLSNFILDELARVLTQKFNLPSKAVQSAVERIERMSIIIQPRTTISVIKEKDDDNRILECAIAGRVDFLITGDKKHILPLASIQGIPIVGVAEFLQKHRPGL